MSAVSLPPATPAVSTPPALRTLVQVVARSFYNDALHIVVLDQLVGHPVLRDDDLAARLGAKVKELRELTAVLRQHGLVSEYQQNELKENRFRASSRSYYYIDYRKFVNVVKWRMIKLRALLDAEARKVIEAKGFACPRCEATYELLQADDLLDMASQTLRCLICRHEVEHHTLNSAESREHGRLGRFNAQTAAVVDALKLADAVPIPAFDVAAAIRQKTQPIDAVAPPEAKVGIFFGEDDDEDAIRLERQAQAAAIREMNALPSWHVSSTVAPPLPAEGRHAQPATASASTSSLPSSKVINVPGASTMPPPAEARAVSQLSKLAEIVAAPRPSKTTTTTTQAGSVDKDKDAEFYDRYYASLQQENVPPTRSANIAAGVKRPRELEDSHDHREAKTARSDACAPGQNIVSRHATNTSESDPDVLVAGERVPFSQITEEHHERMTPDEYLAYFEVLDARGL